MNLPTLPAVGEQVVVTAEFDAETGKVATVASVATGRYPVSLRFADQPGRTFAYAIDEVAPVHATAWSVSRLVTAIDPDAVLEVFTGYEAESSGVYLTAKMETPGGRVVRVVNGRAGTQVWIGLEPGFKGRTDLGVDVPVAALEAVLRAL